MVGLHFSFKRRGKPKPFARQSVTAEAVAPNFCPQLVGVKHKSAPREFHGALRKFHEGFVISAYAIQGSLVSPGTGRV